VAQEATVRFRTAKQESELGDVLTRLVQAGIHVTQFREVQTDLEEAFMTFARATEPAIDAKQVAGGRTNA
jgi:ABC-2 type transport system ATP-binding protein